MDALGDYGSSDSSDNDCGDDTKPKRALSSLLANLSDASDDDDDNEAHAAVAADKTTGDYGNENDELPPNKKMRLGGEEVQDHDSVSHHVVLSPPQLLTSTNNNTSQEADVKTDSDPFHSLLLSSKDYTSQIRQTLTQQSKSQTSDMSQKQKQLADRLKLLQGTFHKSNEAMQQTEQISNSSSNVASSSSFAAHLKSKQEFGNPHLLKDVIDHFQITPLDSKQFKPFEFFDRLQIAEEKARIAAANYNSGNNLS